MEKNKEIDKIYQEGMNKQIEQNYEKGYVDRKCL